jgi:hypothetical protein
MKTIKFFVILIQVSIITMYIGCKDNDPSEPPVTNEHPPATTVTVYLVKYDKSGNLTPDTTKATVRDTSVIKGKPANDGILALSSGYTYKGFLVLMDESATPVENMTEAIIKEKDGHIFIYSVKGNINGRITINELDKDNNGKDFGLNFKLTVSGSGSASGNIHILLRHYDSLNKSDQVFDTDMDSDFPAKIE